MPTIRTKLAKVPAYRLRSGYTQAIVTLTDAVTRKRRDYWLGPHDTPESRECYHRLIAEWEALGRRLPPARTEDTIASPTVGPTIVEIMAEFLKSAEAVQHEKHLAAFKTAFSVLRRLFGQLPAAEFGPKKLRAVRDVMMRCSAVPDGSRTWCRKYVNMQVQRIRQLFKWSAGQELVPAAVYQSLTTLEPLQRGRTAARESERVSPVAETLLNAVRPMLCRPVRALVELQLLTGARAGELLGLRPCDIEMDEANAIWLFKPREQKNAFRNKERTIYFGPKAQEIIRPFLQRRLDAYCFSPAEADKERRDTLHNRRVTSAGQGNAPGTNRREQPQRKPGDRYTTPSYYKSINYACLKAFPLPAQLRWAKGEARGAWKARLGDRYAVAKAWLDAHHFHPHQLRHSAATELRRAFGLEGAQLTLGHASAKITDAIYAERDRAKVIEIMRQIG